MQKPYSFTRKKKAGIIPVSFDSGTLWYREIFVLFYLVFFSVYMLYIHFSDSYLLYLIKHGAEIIYAPGMIFAAGCLMGHQDTVQTDFRKKTLYKALYCLLLFYGISFFYEVFISHRAVFATVKDLLAVLRMPDISKVFLTLSALFLLCSFFWPLIEKCIQNTILSILISLVGLLCSFIPQELLGYAIVGIFIGGDRYECIPVAQYLFVFFTGILVARNIKAEKHLGITNNKKLIALIPVVIVAGGILAILHQKTGAYVLLGSGCAGICVLISIILIPIYKKLEECVLRFLHSLHIFAQRLNTRKKESRPFAIFLYFIGYTLLFVIVGFFVFYPYYQNGRTLIWSVDGLGQYVPKVYRFLSYIPSVLKDLLQGNLDFQQYDFTSGLGATVSISFDPIYWLYLLFNPSEVETAYSLLIILRYYLAGASMSALVLYFKRSPYAAYTASITYAFSGYAIYAGTRHGQFLTPLILLPLLIIAMEQLVSKKKWYLLTILTALSLLCSYYFLYMNTIALGIYFVTRILCTKEYRNFKTFFTRGLIIVGSYVLGVSIGVISLFTSFGSYMGSSRTGGSALSDFLSTTPLFYRSEWISDFFISFLSDSFTPGMWLKLGFAPIAMLAIVLLFTRKNKKELKPIFLIFTFFCFFPIFGYIFSGFGSVTNRWCYIYAAFIAFILAENIEHFTSLTATEIKIMLGLVSLYAGIIFFSTKYRTDKVFGVFGLLMLTVAVILAVNHDKLAISRRMAKNAIFAVTAFAVIMNANMFITSGSDDDSHMDSYVASGTSLSKMSKTALKYLDEITDSSTEGFYRSTNLKTYGNTRSSSLIYGYNDISTFTSTLNGSIVDYNRAMGNCDWNIVSIYSYNLRTYMHELASIRYIGTDSSVALPVPYGYEQVYEKQESDDLTYTIYENLYTLPLGYTYNSITSESEAESLSAAEKQELTMLSAIIEDDAIAANENINNSSDSDLTLTAKKLENVTIKAGKGVTIDGDTITIDDGGGSIKFTFESEPNAETYISLKGDLYFPKDAAEHFLKTKVKADGLKYEYKFRIDSYSTGQEEYLFNLGYREDSIHSCTLKFTSGGTIKFEELAIYSQSMDTYADRVASLQENVLENVTVDTNTVTGDITVNGNKMLVISLPYQKGWTAWVDGEKTEIQKVNYQYMGLNLTEGYHTIRLHYQLPGLRIAFLITAGGLIIFLLIILFNYYRRKRKNAIK